MRMAFWMRIATGAVLGLVALVSLWLLVGVPWLTATVAALLAVVGFLGSFFVVTADRPEEGYEQVLFDRPNTLISLALVVALAGAGVATGFLGGASAPADLTPAQRTHALAADYQRVADAWTKDAPKEETLARVAELRVESDRIALELEALPEGAERTALVAANDALAFALDALKDCAGKDQRSCMDARLNAADAQAALARLAAQPAE